MSVSPINFNGLMQRSQDVSTVKTKEDQQPVTQQHQLGDQQEKKVNLRMQRTNEADKKDGTDTRHDAREEGRNKYFSQNKQNDNSKPNDSFKKKNQSSGFDIKI